MYELTSINGTIRGTLNGKLHSIGDMPAVISNNCREWYRHGLHHRDDGPAVENSNGDREWYVNGIRHREDGPAIVCANGSRSWYRNGLLHRENGPAIELAGGACLWYKNGMRCNPPVDMKAEPNPWPTLQLRNRQYNA